MKKFIPLFLFPSILLGSFAKKGLVGAKFLNLSVGTRAVAMGEAFSAVGDNAETIYWNPAGISSTIGTSVYIDRIDYWAEIGINSISFVQSLGPLGAVGFFYSGLSSGEWEETTTEYPLGNGTYVSYNAFQTGLSYARFLTGHFSFGMNFKIIREDYPDFSRSFREPINIAVDVGGYFETGFRDLRLGIVIQHFGPDVSLGSSSYPLPTTFRTGLADCIYRHGGVKATVAVDVIHSLDNTGCLALGFEFDIKRILKMRTGYQFGRGADKGVGNFNFGVGLLKSGNTGDFEIGYSFTHGNIMPEIHRISLLIGM